MSITAKPLIDAQYAEASATTEYTCPGSTYAIIDKFTATNISAGAVALTVYIVPSGETLGDNHIIIDALSIAAGTCLDLSELQNQILKASDVISVFAASANAIVIRASGREVSA